MREEGNQDLKFIHDDSESVVSKLALNEQSNYLVGASFLLLLMPFVF
jgi:hypothetical protein